MTRAYFDVHLMISEPLRYAPAMVKAGAQNVTFHVEAVTDPAQAADEIRKLGCQVGITLKPGTPVESLWPALDRVDVVLIMSVEPGFGGQQFMPQMLAKVRECASGCARTSAWRSTAGFIPRRSPRRARRGWIGLSSAAAIFDSPDRAAAIAALRAKLGGESGISPSPGTPGEGRGGGPGI